MVDQEEEADIGQRLVQLSTQLLGRSRPTGQEITQIEDRDQVGRLLGRSFGHRHGVFPSTLPLPLLQDLADQEVDVVLLTAAQELPDHVLVVLAQHR